MRSHCLPPQQKKKKECLGKINPLIHVANFIRDKDERRNLHNTEINMEMRTQLSTTNARASESDVPPAKLSSSWTHQSNNAIIMEESLQGGAGDDSVSADSQWSIRRIPTNVFVLVEAMMSQFFSNMAVYYCSSASESNITHRSKLNNYTVSASNDTLVILKR